MHLFLLIFPSFFFHQPFYFFFMHLFLLIFLFPFSYVFSFFAISFPTAALILLFFSPFFPPWRSLWPFLTLFGLLLTSFRAVLVGFEFLSCWLMIAWSCVTFVFVGLVVRFVGSFSFVGDVRCSSFDFFCSLALDDFFFDCSFFALVLDFFLLTWWFTSSRDSRS